MNFEQLMAGLPEFADKAYRLADRLGFVRAQLHADHIALRITELADAIAIKEALLQRGKLLSEKQINGRPILLIQLDTPMQVGPWAIELVELPFPDGKKRRDGWEHVELVLPCDAEDKAQMLLAIRQVPAIIAKWPVLSDSSIGIEMKASCPKGEGEPLSNPTVAFRHDGITVKVHPWDIRQILGLMPVEDV
ncbi:VOC family protein [Ferrimonas lipolytica]|uniref:VOC family protein n=1 Tax=Ferrimonas lipolytica TaxID=2724191 RepID=A0A6H1UBE2_9GAMM|nr:VOC family protein [Ferrimonas lipolytica]QIZ76375.1 VOC family protein [Ferrimonas lipolytica]